MLLSHASVHGLKESLYRFGSSARISSMGGAVEIGNGVSRRLIRSSCGSCRFPFEIDGNVVHCRTVLSLLC
jgi:hypothetical protein